jgi:hypothetical protein
MLFKKMVLFAIIANIAIFDHYYKFRNVFKAKFERKTIRNVPKPNVIVKIRNFIPKLPVSLALLTYTLIKYANSAIKVLPEAIRKTRDDLATKIFHMWSGHVFNMETWFQLHFNTNFVLFCNAELQGVETFRKLQLYKTYTTSPVYSGTHYINA